MLLFSIIFKFSLKITVHFFPLTFHIPSSSSYLLLFFASFWLASTEIEIARLLSVTVYCFVEMCRLGYETFFAAVSFEIINRKSSRPWTRLFYRNDICFSSHLNNINQLNMWARFSLCHWFPKTLNIRDQTRFHRVTLPKREKMWELEKRKDPF